MDDVFLKFDDSAAAAAALSAAGLAGPPDGSWTLEHVGSVWTLPVLDEAGEVVTPVVEITGHHVNVRMVSGSLPETLTTFRVYPSVPYRRFA